MGMAMPMGMELDMPTEMGMAVGMANSEGVPICMTKTKETGTRQC